jgi:hypothetical protein
MEGHPMRAKTTRLLLLLASLLSLAAPAGAQITGAIRGTVMDASGAVLPGVSITVRSPALVRGEVTIATDSQGNYREVTVLGARSTTNGFLIDGMQNRDDFSGGFKEFFIQDAIQEFNVNIAGFMPEHGLASGAVINIITKSGTNDFRGRAFLFTRNDALDSSSSRAPRPTSAHGLE